MDLQFWRNSMHDSGWKADVVGSSTGSYPRRLEFISASLGKP